MSNILWPTKLFKGFIHWTLFISQILMNVRWSRAQITASVKTHLAVLIVLVNPVFQAKVAQVGIIIAYFTYNESNNPWLSWRTRYCQFSLSFSIPFHGGMCGRAVNTSNSRSRGSGFKPRPSLSSLDNKRYSTLLFTSPTCINGYHRHTAWG